MLFRIVAVGTWLDLPASPSSVEGIPTAVQQRSSPLPQSNNLIPEIRIPNASPLSDPVLGLSVIDGGAAQAKALHDVAGAFAVFHDSPNRLDTNMFERFVI